MNKAFERGKEDEDERTIKARTQGMRNRSEEGLMRGRMNLAA